MKIVGGGQGAAVLRQQPDTTRRSRTPRRTKIENPASPVATASNLKTAKLTIVRTAHPYGLLFRIPQAEQQPIILGPRVSVITGTIRARALAVGGGRRAAGGGRSLDGSAHTRAKLE
ncbi:hypothetical protein EVAR_99601_1 [Eumeta japonica]|uniref:Uncharacterized protein n=1 Tax=Eumeta variegata TaxID=151549 RepID=A0A4C1ZTW0_EUMVA|nr:hypothetical protein EVAR_99601_1 [Eumeta japonica]